MSNPTTLDLSDVFYQFQIILLFDIFNMDVLAVYLICHNYLVLNFVRLDRCRFVYLSVTDRYTNSANSVYSRQRLSSKTMTLNNRYYNMNNFSDVEF